jgi:hypothetical protein
MAWFTVTGKAVEPSGEGLGPEASDVPPPQAPMLRAATAAKAGTILRNTMMLLGEGEGPLGQEAPRSIRSALPNQKRVRVT